MKKRLHLLNIPAIAVATFSPLCVLSSCGQSNSYSSITQTVIDEFKNLTSIPHSSDKFLNEAPYELGNCWNLSNYLRDRVSSILNKYVFQDKYGNIVFDVEANDDSLKDAPKIALQAHLDMVFAYNPNDIEFKPDPRTWKIKLVEDTIDGKKVLHSDKYRTSIGADDGIGIASILALIQHNEIKHGPLRCIFTNCEENGSQGGALLVEETYPNVMKGISYVVNLDGEDLGDIFVACSGAVGSYYYINTQQPKTKEETGHYVPEHGENFFKITIDGFPGGHSGVDMPKRIDNALVVMNDLLNQLNAYKCNEEETSWVRLNAISTPGSDAYNSIPKTCEVVICIDNWKDYPIDKINNIVQGCFDQVLKDRKDIKKSEFDKRTDFDKQFDPAQYDKVTCTVSAQTPKYPYALNKKDTVKILMLQSQREIPYGIICWPTDEEMKQLTGVQTSSNIGPATGNITSNTDFEYKLSTYSRSSEEEDIEMYFKLNQMAAVEAGAEYKYDAKFNPWHVDENKKLLDMCKKGWVNAGLKESDLKTSRTHGGLECSWWHEAMEKTNPEMVGKTAIVSYGPQLHNVHNYMEYVELDSIETCMNTTIYILNHANELK